MEQHDVKEPLDYIMTDSGIDTTLWCECEDMLLSLPCKCKLFIIFLTEIEKKNTFQVSSCIADAREYFDFM